MSDAQIVMKFEFLPNEILIECLEYLNSLDIFYSFDQLNNHFNTLIRSIPLYLTFENIHHKFLCDQFCMKMSSDQTIKKQIRALHLSNKNTCYPIHLFLSIFSLLEFSHLQSLILTKVTQSNSEYLKSMLPLMTKLSSFRMTDSDNVSHEVQSISPLSHLPTLMVLDSCSGYVPVTEFSSITNLSISKCSLYKLSKLLHVALKLNYLKIGHVNNNSSRTMTKPIGFINYHTSNLKKLNIMMFRGKFYDLVTILNQTPNLKSLTINTIDNENMADACQWQYLITSSLPNLNIFKFNFQFSYSKENNTVEEKFKQFQNDFWYNQHHWYTEYLISNHSASIYSIPYLFDTFELTSDMNRYTNQFNNDVNTFDNVKNLTIYPETLTEKSQFYFSNVNSLTFGEAYLSHYIVIDMKHMEYMMMVVNLSNLKHLTISDSIVFHKTRNVMKEIIKKAPQLSSLKIDLGDLLNLSEDHELCAYLTKMIKTLDMGVDRYSISDQPYLLHQFCKVFTNLEQLTCTYEVEESLFLIKHLSKLTFLSISSASCRYPMSWLEEEVHKLDLDITSDFSDDDFQCKYLSIWIYRNTH